MSSHWMQPEAMKAAQWEICKGHLRALTALQGSYSGEPERWRKLNAKVEEFITEVNDNGLAD